MGLKTVVINEKKQIFLDGEKVENVTAYKLESSAGKPAKLTLEMLVIVGQVAFEGEKKGMQIQEAIKGALETNRCITLPEFIGKSKIKPTKGKGNCIVMEADGSWTSKYGWQPTAEELLRDDWENVD